MKKAFHSNQAPAAIGTYSQAVAAGRLVFLSGQIPLDPGTMNLIEGDFNDQVRRVFLNLQAVCQAADRDLDDIVRLTVYLTDMENFPKVNRAMLEFFNEPYPARAAVGVAALPKGAEVEIDAILNL
jgi:reactive intermediate/imine deaminase